MGDNADLSGNPDLNSPWKAYAYCLACSPDGPCRSYYNGRASSRDRTKAREGLLRTATGSLQPDLPPKSSQFGTCRPTNAYGRYHHLRDVAGQPVNAPGPLDSCIVMWRGGETIGASRCTDLLGIRLSLRHLHPNYPIDTKDSGTRGRYNWRQREELVESPKLLHRSGPAS